MAVTVKTCNVIFVLF